MKNSLTLFFNILYYTTIIFQDICTGFRLRGNRSVFAIVHLTRNQTEFVVALDQIIFCNAFRLRFNFSRNEIHSSMCLRITVHQIYLSMHSCIVSSMYCINYILAKYPPSAGFPSPSGGVAPSTPRLGHLRRHV